MYKKIPNYTLYTVTEHFKPPSGVPFADNLKRTRYVTKGNENYLRVTKAEEGL